MEKGYFLKILQGRIALAVIGNQKGSGFRSTTANDRHLLFQKFGSVFQHFPDRVENKKSYGSLRILNIFKSVLQITVGIVGLYKKSARRQRVVVQLSLPFPGGKFVHAWKKMKTLNIFGTVQPIFFIFTICLANNRLLNKNCWDQGHIKLTFHNFAYISDITGPILTRYRPK